ncbi:MAG TPA: tRNA-binding protein [Candidatus Dormibacteraeota bacterium]|nr:tRNA-binding protein [Candidatus Dormibacteraeota bacterium]
MNDIRVGTILVAEAFPEARRPAYKLTIDFGTELGTKRSSAQITERYTTDQLRGMQVLAVIDLGPKTIARFTSEVLVLGLPDERGHVVLLRPDSPVSNGAKGY